MDQNQTTSHKPNKAWRGIAAIVLIALIAGAAAFFSSPKKVLVSSATSSVTNKSVINAVPGRIATATPPVATTLPPAVLNVGKVAGTLKLASSVLGPDKRLPLDYTCYRANTSPPLTWQGAPRGTESFVLFLERQEKNKPAFINWVVFDIPNKATGLPANLPKQGVIKDGTKQAQSDYNSPEYVGPCEPKGTINYVFRLFAIDSELKLDAGAKRDDLIRAMNGHILDEADLKFVHYYQM